MSLENKIVRAVDRAFSSLDDLAGPFTINEVVETYDPVTGSANRVETPYIVTGIFDSFSAEELNTNTLIESGDVKVLIKPIDSFKPSIGDVLVYNTIEYTILNVESITAYDKDFLWELHVRK
jgi:hypothetical protein